MADSNAAEQAIEENILTMDRRRSDRRGADDEAQQAADGIDQEAADGIDQEAKATNAPRPKKQRRRHIDPTTCERDYNDDEIEFMRAIDDYKHDSGRMFPTCSEVLEVIRGLGYVRMTDGQTGELQVVGFEDSGELDPGFEDGDDLEETVN